MMSVKKAKMSAGIIMSEDRIKQLRVMQHDIESFLRDRVTVLNAIFAALIWFGVAIVGSPENYTAAHVERITGLSAEMYGAFIAICAAFGLATQYKSRPVVLLALVPFAQHTLWVLIFNFQEGYAVLGLPVPIYALIIVLLMIELLKAEPVGGG